MIKVFIADSHPLVRKILKEILEREADVRVIGDAANTQDVMDGVAKGKPNVLITSLSLGGITVFSMISDVKRLNPKISVLVLTMHPEERFAVRTLRSGASGYLTKDIAPEEIIRAVRALVSGKRYITLSLMEKLALESDTEAGREIHGALSEGDP